MARNYITFGGKFFYMNKVFIDCGSNKGQGLRSFIEKYNMDKDWLIDLYEPNPLCRLNENIIDLTDKLNITVNNSAVFDYSGTINFSQFLENDEGSSVNCLMSKGVCSDVNNPSYRKHDTIIDVRCVDICDVLHKYKKDDFIVVKMDIEGSEFSTLRKLLKSNYIEYINDLYVEWHTPFVNGEDDSSCDGLKTLIKQKGINLHEWH
jgi:FkbM family methyltransferase